MSDDFKLQVNFKVPTVPNDNYRDALINVRANSVDELNGYLAKLAAAAAEVVNTGKVLSAAAAVAYGLGGSVVPQVDVVSHNTPGYQNQQPAPQAQPQQQAPRQNQGGGGGRLTPEQFEWQLPLEQLNLNGLDFFYWTKPDKKTGTPKTGAAFKDPASGNVVHWAKWLKN